MKRPITKSDILDRHILSGLVSDDNFSDELEDDFYDSDQDMRYFIKDWLKSWVENYEYSHREPKPKDSKWIWHLTIEPEAIEILKDIINDPLNESSNPLKAAAKKHRRKNKGNSLWFFPDYEKGIEYFNKINSPQGLVPTSAGETQASNGEGAGEGICEDLEIYDAIAYIRGNSKYPDISGTIKFYSYGDKVKIAAFIENLPDTENKIFGFHIHSGESCTGDEEDEFKDVKMHYNPSRQQHPKHAGDLPVLMSTNGHAELEFLTNRFNLDEIIGKAVIVHLNRDDFESQPAGDAGEKIACGIIQKD